MKEPNRDLPLLAQAMRERGLDVRSCYTRDQGYLKGYRDAPREVVVIWGSPCLDHHQRIAAHLADCDVFHDGVRSMADQSRDPASITQ